MSEDVDIREVEIVPIRRQGTEEHWSAMVAITQSIREAGLEDGGSFQFDPDAADELGMVPAFGSEETVDGRRNPLTRNVKHGSGETALRLVIPKDVLEALGIDPDEIDWDDPPEVTVWAGDQLLAFERAGEQILSFDREGVGDE